MAKNIDGAYEADPRKNPQARRYKSIRYMDVLERGIQVMDSTATSLCMDNDIPLELFALKGEDSILKAVCGEGNGTIVSNKVETEFY